MASTTDGGGAIAPPEPDLTPEEMIRRAVAMRPELVRRQADVEELRYYPEDVHEAFDRAGFYRIYQPRRYGGYGFDVTTYVRVAIELARGCPNSAWCLLLGRQPRAADRLVVASVRPGGDLRRRRLPLRLGRGAAERAGGPAR